MFIINKILHIIAFPALIYSVAQGSLAAPNQQVGTLSADVITEHFKDIYTVELILFRHNATQTQEINTPPSALNYPDSLIFLTEERLKIDASTNDFPKSEGDSSELTRSNEGPHPTNQAIDLVTKIEATPLPIDTTPSANDILQSLTPPLLEKLANHERSLNKIATRLQRRSAYSVLFHEAWHQRLSARESAPSIPVWAGEKYDQHHQLEGYITVSKNRFLHITTQLWLSKFTLLNNALDQRPWYDKLIDTIPLPTSPRPAITIEEPYLEKTELEGPVLKGAHVGEPLIGDIQSANTPIIEVQTNNHPKYGAIAVSVLAEYRRLKRGEIHYLDHPDFGAIIMLKKFEPKIPKNGANGI